MVPRCRHLRALGLLLLLGATARPAAAAHAAVALSASSSGRRSARAGLGTGEGRGLGSGRIAADVDKRHWRLELDQAAEAEEVSIETGELQRRPRDHDPWFMKSLRTERHDLVFSSWNKSPGLSQLRFYLSIVIALAGSTLTVTGMLLQKAARQKPEEERMSKYYCMQWRWIFGLSVFGTGNIVTWIALGMGPNSVLACFNSWNIIFSMLVGPIWFGEAVPTSAKLSAGALIVGCIAVTCTGPRSYRLHTVQSINLLFTKFPFSICCSCCFIILVLAKVRHCLVGASTVWTNLATVQITSMASIFACYAVLFSKCTSMVVNSSITTGTIDFGHWQFYLWAAATVVCGVCQIHFLNESLHHGDASFVIPAYESMGMVLQIVVGGIFFCEYSNFGLLRHMAFWPGVACVVVGLVALTSSSASGKVQEAPKKGAENEESENEEAEGGKPPAGVAKAS